jgi:uncharacterized repeat protein (TIGR02543 family)
MGLQLNGTSQGLTAPWAVPASQPMTFMFWLRQVTLMDGWSTARDYITASLSTSAEAYNSAQVAREDNGPFARGISFSPYKEIRSAESFTDLAAAHLVIIEFTGTSILCSLDGVETSIAWAAASTEFDILAIGRRVTTGTAEWAKGIVEHVAIWAAALTSEERAALLAKTVNPAAVQPSALISYKPLKDSLADAKDTLTWTALDLASPTYVDLEVTYPSVGDSVTYAGNGSTSGSVPVDSSSPYTSGAEVAVLGNTGSLARLGYSFAGWNTSADGSGTSYVAGDKFTIAADVVLYAQWTRNVRNINHDAVDATELTSTQEAAAAALKVYFEHASTGQDIVGDSSVDSSSGGNHDASLTCGLALLRAAYPSRFLLSRSHFDSGNDSTWFATHAGLQDNNRGNPTPALKLSDFVGMSSAMRAAVNVAMFKYCWIDVQTGTSGYVTDGAVKAATDIAAIEAFEEENPGITIVYWTMPLMSTESWATRDAYNAAIRAYCAANNKWLFDIADIESYSPAGDHTLDSNSREIAYSTYVVSDGGHLADVGSLRLAHAFWRLLGAIATSETPNYAPNFYYFRGGN